MGEGREFPRVTQAGSVFTPIFDFPEETYLLEVPGTEGEAARKLVNKIRDLYVIKRETGPLYDKLMAKAVYIPFIDRDHWTLFGSEMKSFRDEMCSNSKDTMDLVDNISGMNSEGVGESDLVKNLDYARRHLLPPPDTSCDRGSASGMFSAEAVEKGLLLDKTFVGLISTRTMEFAQFLMESAHTNSVMGTLGIEMLANDEMLKVEEGETDFEQWDQDKKDIFWARLDTCKNGLLLYKNEEDGTYAMSLTVYDGKQRSHEDICLSAMAMIVPPEAIKVDPAGENALAGWDVLTGGQKETANHPLKPTKDYLKKVFMGNKQETWVGATRFLGTEIDGYSWVPTAKRVTYWTMLGGAGVAALRVLVGIPFIGSAVHHVADAVGVPTVWDKVVFPLIYAVGEKTRLIKLGKWIASIWPKVPPPPAPPPAAVAGAGDAAGGAAAAAGGAAMLGLSVGLSVFLYASGVSAAGTHETALMLAGAPKERDEELAGIIDRAYEHPVLRDGVYWMEAFHRKGEMSGDPLSARFLELYYNLADAKLEGKGIAGQARAKLYNEFPELFE